MPALNEPGGRDGGAEEQGSREYEDIDAARAMLNRMREAAHTRGERRAAARHGGLEADAATRRRNTRKRPGREAGQAAAGGRDPQGLGTVFTRLVRDRGWSSPVAVGSVIGRWAELVGPEIAAHCQPESFADTTVQVRCDSTAWATQLRLLSPNLLAKFDAELGAGVVTRIQVIGPAAPNWRKGHRRVSGRGPRDTYG
jgi:predicted nucleic acid-binding Zn ribbon protein